MSKLNLFIYVSENSGVGYYRGFLPAWAIREKGLAEVHINDFRWGEGNHVELTEKVFFEQCNWADIIVVGRLDLPHFYAKWQAAKEFFNKPIIIDTDDNVHHVPLTNPGSQGYNPTTEAGMWNLYALERIFDAVTVTTEELKRFYSKYHPRIYVLPNNLDIPEWEKHAYRRKKHEEVRMGFICSAAHAEGFGIIQKPVYDIMKKYGNTVFYYPAVYSRLFTNAPEEVKSRIKPMPWAKLKDWPKELTKLSLDIGLAPLRDNLFNRGKSNLRWLEYSMAGMASIVSPVSPYLCINNGVDGIIAKSQDEWYNAIESLLDVDKRREIADNAKKRVSQEFNIWTNAQKWVDVYQEVYDKYHDFYGKAKQFQEIKKGEYRQIA